MFTNDTAAKFCHMLVTREVPANAARVGAWIIGAAEASGGFPIELTMRQIGKGYTKDGVTLVGTGSRWETITDALEWLEDNGVLRSSPGRGVGFGHQSKIYTFRI